MKNMKIATVITFIVCFTLLNGCLQKTIPPPEQPLDLRFLGTWSTNSSNVTLTFYNDGTCLLSSCGCERFWETENNTVSFYVPDESGVKKILIEGYNYSFSNNNETMMLSNVHNNSFNILIKQGREDI
jgi:hypothetical protein